jgi:hypothetical protein
MSKICSHYRGFVQDISFQWGKSASTKPFGSFDIFFTLWSNFALDAGILLAGSRKYGVS